MILKALRLSTAMIFKLRFAAQILTSMVTLTLITPSFASSHMAYQQPSYGDNPNLMRVLLHKTKQKLLPSSTVLAPPINTSQVAAPQTQVQPSLDLQAVDQHLIRLPLTPKAPQSKKITQAQAVVVHKQIAKHPANLAPLSSHNVIHIPQLVDLSRLNKQQPRIIIEQIPTEIEDDYFSNNSP